MLGATRDATGEGSVVGSSALPYSNYTVGAAQKVTEEWGGNGGQLVA